MELAAPTSLNNVVILVTEQQSCLLGFSTNTARMWLLLLAVVAVATQSTRLLGTVKLFLYIATCKTATSLSPTLATLLVPFLLLWHRKLTVKSVSGRLFFQLRKQWSMAVLHLAVLACCLVHSMTCGETQETGVQAAHEVTGMILNLYQLIIKHSWW